jgi:hypothetical protein
MSGVARDPASGHRTVVNRSTFGVRESTSPMSEPQEFGGPINRPAHNARQVTPGEAQEGFHSSGGGLDFLGLNEQVQSTAPQPLPQAAQQAPPQAESWLMQMPESASVDLTPPKEIQPYVPAQATAPSPTATSLLNASWREEPAPARRSRWIAPIAGGAALAVLGMIGLPLLRKPEPSPATPASTTARAPAPKKSSEPEAAFPSSEPVAVEEDASSELVTELTPVEPVEPDPMLDRARPGKSSLRRTAALESGRSEAPVNAPPPGASFVPPPVEVFDPAGVWQVQSGDDDVDTGGEATFDAQAADDGAASGPSASASGAPAPEALLAVRIQGDECPPQAERQAPLPDAVEVDWERLIWIARTEAERAEATPSAAEEEPAKPRGAKKRGRKNAEPQDEGISRALAAWLGGDEPQTKTGEATASAQESGASAPSSTDVASSESAADGTATSSEVAVENPWTNPVAEVAATEKLPENPAESALDDSPEIAPEIAPESASEIASEVALVAPPAVPATQPAVEPIAAPVAQVVQPESDESTANASTPTPVDEPIVALSEGAESILDPLAPPTSPELDALSAPKVKVLGRGSRRALRHGDAMRRGSDEVAAQELASVTDEPSSAPMAQAPSAAVAQAAPTPTHASPTSPAVAIAPSSIPTPESTATETSNSTQVLANVSAAPATPASTPSEPSAPLDPIASLDPIALPQAANADKSAGGERASTPAVSAAGSSQPKASTVRADAAPTRALKVATESDLERVRGGQDVPLDALNAKVRMATPDVGKARVVFHTGEIFEGDLVAVGEGCLWLRGKHGTLGLDGARVKSATRLAPGDAPVLGAPGSQKLAGLPRARVKTPGGPLFGKIVERDEHHTTLITDSGARVVLDSRSVEVLTEEPRVQIRP